VRSRGKAPGQGVRGRSPPEADDISHLKGSLNGENCTLLCYLCSYNNATICTETLVIDKLDDHDYGALSVVNNYANTRAVQLFYRSNQ
jgi:hypothetical protein